MKELWIYIIGLILLIVCCAVIATASTPTMPDSFYDDLTGFAPQEPFIKNKSSLNDIDCIRAIIGEASGEGYDGMLAVAVGIRNRGTLKGVYGLKAKHVDNEPHWVWEQARLAWNESKNNRIHTGTHWENIKQFGKPSWADDSKEVYRHKNHVFYKL